jgi:hypothetical protein
MSSRFLTTVSRRGGRLPTYHGVFGSPPSIGDVVRRRQINVLHEPGIDEARRGDAAADRGNAADPVIAAKPRERRGQIVVNGDHGDPPPARDLVCHFPDALIARQQEHRYIGRGEDSRVEIEIAVLRHHHLREVTRQAKLRAQCDQLWMVEGEEHRVPDARCAREHTIGCDAR